jgi:hypothetical protein
VSLADALEAAAGALTEEAEAIRPANGDPARLLATLSDAGAARVAAWLLAHRSVDADELAEAWCEDARGQAALLAVAEDGLPKEGRKLLRRLRHRLRSRGVATPEAVPAPTVARLPEVDDALGGAYVTALDPMGARQLWWIESSPAAGTRLFECALDDARGVLAFEVYSPTRSDLRRFLRNLEGALDRAVFAVAPETAKALLLRAAERQATDRSAPRRWIEWRTRLGAPPEAKLPGALASEALAATGSDRDALAVAARLVAEGRIGPWPPPRPVLAALVERFRTAVDSPLVVSGATRREQLAAQVEAAAADAFAGDAAQLAAHRLREAAFSFWRRGEEEEARACLAAARAFAAQPVAENPVARAFAEVWFRPLLAAEPGGGAAGPEPESPLLVRP